MLWLGAVIAWSATAAPLHAQSDTAVVRFDPPVLQVGEGQVEQLNIIVENAHDVYGIELRAGFDPQEIEIVDVDLEREGVQMRSGDFIKPDFLVRNQADNAVGTLEYVITQTNPTPPATGSGVVLTVLVRGKKQGGSSPVIINLVQAANNKGVKLPIEPQSGMIQVVPPKPETETPVVAPTTGPITVTSATATRAPATRTRPTSVPTKATNNGSTELVTNVILVGVALGGCLLAVIILGVGILVLMRKPRAKPPQNPHGQ